MVCRAIPDIFHEPIRWSFSNPSKIFLVLMKVHLGLNHLFCQRMISHPRCFSTHLPTHSHIHSPSYSHNHTHSPHMGNAECTTKRGFATRLGISRLLAHLLAKHSNLLNGTLPGAAGVGEVECSLAFFLSSRSHKSQDNRWLVRWLVVLWVGWLVDW